MYGHSLEWGPEVPPDGLTRKVAGNDTNSRLSMV